MDVFRAGIVVLLVSVLAIFALALTQVSRQVRAGRALRRAEVGALGFAVVLLVTSIVSVVRAIYL